MQRQFSANLRESVVPIVTVLENEVTGFLGTGKFVESNPQAITSDRIVGSRQYLITAKHVVNNVNGTIAIVTVVDENLSVFPANLILSDRDLDLAVIDVSGYSPSPQATFYLAKEVSSLNDPVCCFEYGTTRQYGDRWDFDPAMRTGNITRILRELPGRPHAGDQVLELSFPALLGASGSPVFTNPAIVPTSGLTLLGIVIENVGYHLLPVHIETILDEKNQILRETQFLLPQAIAINVKHVEGLIRQAVIKQNTEKWPT